MLSNKSWKSFTKSTLFKVFIIWGIKYKNIHIGSFLSIIASEKNYPILECYTWIVFKSFKIIENNFCYCNYFDLFFWIPLFEFLDNFYWAFIF
jgi:hypothetical protein